MVRTSCTSIKNYPKMLYGICTWFLKRIFRCMRSHTGYFHQYLLKAHSVGLKDHFSGKIMMYMGIIWQFLAQPSVAPWLFGDKKSTDLAVTQCKDQSGTWSPPPKHPITDSPMYNLPPYRGLTPPPPPHKTGVNIFISKMLYNPPHLTK